MPNIFTWRVETMTEEKDTSAETEMKGKKKKKEDQLPFCTTAPSAEHERGGDTEEPCDDYRSGK